MAFRFHVLGIPHTISNKDYVACAFTQKVVKFCEMMQPHGHTIIHYGHELSDVCCDENVPVSDNQTLEQSYGGWDWKKNNFRYNTNDYAYTQFYSRVVPEIEKRKQSQDFLLCFWGAGHSPIAEKINGMLVVEPGIGYPGGIFAPYKVFESYHIMSAWFNMTAVRAPNHYNWYDSVIPNYFNVDDFDYSPIKDDYFLYLGRIGEHKGVHIAIQVCEQIGAKLLVAGQGSLELMNWSQDRYPFVEYVGYADVETRRQLLSRARGLFVPTLYGEPFGGVQIEAMLSGTPVISTDWACFGELNLHGVTGYRCRTFDHFVWAANNIDKINPLNCRDWAERNFTYPKIRSMYEEYFSNVLNSKNDSRGWYAVNSGRTEMDWLYRHYPNRPQKATKNNNLPFDLR